MTTIRAVLLELNLVNNLLKIPFSIVAPQPLGLNPSPNQFSSRDLTEQFIGRAFVSAYKQTVSQLQRIPYVSRFDQLFAPECRDSHIYTASQLQRGSLYRAIATQDLRVFR